jgi:hypothetical protein
MHITQQVRPHSSTRRALHLWRTACRPSLLDGKTYASYGARYEGRIVQEMIRKDGGKGEYVESTPPMLTIWDTFLKVWGLRDGLRRRPSCACAYKCTREAALAAACGFHGQICA